MLNNKDFVMTDKSIKWSSGNSVLKYQAGDQIKLSEKDFVAICKAFFAEIEDRFSGEVAARVTNPEATDAALRSLTARPAPA